MFCSSFKPRKLVLSVGLCRQSQYRNVLYLFHSALPTLVSQQASILQPPALVSQLLNHCEAITPYPGFAASFNFAAPCTGFTAADSLQSHLTLTRFRRGHQFRSSPHWFHVESATAKPPELRKLKNNWKFNKIFAILIGSHFEFS